MLSALVESVRSQLQKRFGPQWEPPSGDLLQPGMRALIGVATQMGGVAWTVCTVRSVLDGRVWAQLETVPHELERERGERFEVLPESVVLVFKPAARAANP